MNIRMLGHGDVLDREKIYYEILKRDSKRNLVHFDGLEHYFNNLPQFVTKELKVYRILRICVLGQAGTKEMASFL